MVQDVPCRLQLIIQPLETTQGVLKPARLRLLAVPNFDPICMYRARSIAQWPRDSSGSQAESPQRQGFAVALVLCCVDLTRYILNYSQKDDDSPLTDSSYSCDKSNEPLE